MIKSGVIFIFGIYTKQDNGNEKIIGQISISDYNSRNQSIEVGYLLMLEYRKNGYMKLAMEKMCAFLFTETPINKIYAQTGEFNVSSIKLLDSFHFSCDGHLREHHELDGILYDDCIYSLIKNDWEKMNLS
jgi:ribosomal-protein-alanine N-acetyltransferase